MLAFNKHIANELQARVPDTVEVRTLNAFGYSICRDYVPKVKVDLRKIEFILKRNMDTSDKEGYIEFLKLKRPVQQIVDILKGANIQHPTIEDALAAIDLFAIDTEDDQQAAHFAIKCFNESIADQKNIDFSDQLFLPIYNNWSIPTYDFVFIDEAQDLNAIQQELVVRAGARGRVLMVGDPKQAIYGFRGADYNAFCNLEQRLEAKPFPLSKCYRCREQIVTLAKSIVPQIEHHSPGGTVRTCKPSEFKPCAGDYVLCRTNAPLVSACLDLIADDRKAVILGRDIADGLKQTVYKIGRDALGSTVQSHQQFRNELELWYTEQRERWQYKEHKLAIAEDKYNVLCILLSKTGQNSDIVQALVNKVDAIFSAEGAEITLSTIHKAKGLEADRVWLLRPEDLPFLKYAHNESAREQEFNIKYVAITRAKEELVFVSSEEQQQ